MEFTTFIFLLQYQVFIFCMSGLLAFLLVSQIGTLRLRLGWGKSVPDVLEKGLRGGFSFFFFFFSLLLILSYSLSFSII